MDKEDLVKLGIIGESGQRLLVLPPEVLELALKEPIVSAVVRAAEQSGMPLVPVLAMIVRELSVALNAARAEIQKRLERECPLLVIKLLPMTEEQKESTLAGLAQGGPIVSLGPMESMRIGLAEVWNVYRVEGEGDGYAIHVHEVSCASEVSARDLVAKGIAKLKAEGRQHRLQGGVLPGTKSHAAVDFKDEDWKEQEKDAYWLHVGKRSECSGECGHGSLGGWVIERAEVVQ